MIEFTDPKINSYGGNTAKQWYVWYKATNPLTGEKKLFIQKRGINRIKNKSERMKEAVGLRDALIFELKHNNYNPFKKDWDRPASSLIEALENILEIKKAVLRGRSIVHYKDVLASFKKYLKVSSIYGILPGKFNSSHAMAYGDYMLKERKISGKTYNIHISTLRTFYNALVERDIVKVNPFKEIKKLPESDGSNIPYTDKEKEKLIQYLKAHKKRLYFAVCFVYFCFIRRTELIRLKVGDIDLKNHTILIQPYTSKIKRSRVITIPTAFDPILKEMGLDKHSPEDYVFGQRFQTCSRRIVKPESLTYAMTAVNRKFKIKDKSFYTWKHTGMCELYKATHDPYICMAQAGHSDLRMTLRYLRSLGLSVNENVRKVNFDL